MGSFFVITNHDHSQLAKDQCNYEDERLSNKLILPNLPCYYDESTLTQSFHTMTTIQRSKIVEAFKDGIDVSMFNGTLHEILGHHYRPYYISIEKFGNAISDDKEYNGFVQIFAGGGSPNVNNIYTSHQVASSSVTVHHKVSSTSDFSDFVPLSTACFDYRFHAIQVVDKFVEGVEKAVGKKGLFPVRNRAKHIGSASYIGERATSS